MAEYKEIVTKTIIGKCKKSFTNEYNIETEEQPNTILGCWIINHTFNGTTINNKVEVTGSYDVNTWYSYDNDTKTSVNTKNIIYKETIPLKILDSYDNNNEVIIKSLKQPTVSNVNIKEGIVNLTIEKELGVEIIGNTKLKVPYETFEDEYIEIEDSFEEEIDKVNEEYIN